MKMASYLSKKSRRSKKRQCDIWVISQEGSFPYRLGVTFILKSPHTLSVDCWERKRQNSDNVARPLGKWPRWQRPLDWHQLTHLGRATHICVSKLTIIGSDNGLLPDWCQAIIWTYAGILLIGPLRTKFSEILIEILTFSFKKMHFKVSSAKWQPFYLGLNVLNINPTILDQYWISV